MALALESIERVSEGLRLFAREEVDITFAFKVLVLVTIRQTGPRSRV
jgi:hypothetical protein